MGAKKSKSNNPKVECAPTFLNNRNPQRIGSYGSGYNGLNGVGGSSYFCVPFEQSMGGYHRQTNVSQTKTVPWFHNVYNPRTVASNRIPATSMKMLPTINTNPVYNRIIQQPQTQSTFIRPASQFTSLPSAYNAYIPSIPSNNNSLEYSLTTSQFQPQSAIVRTSATKKNAYEQPQTIVIKRRKKSKKKKHHKLCHPSMQMVPMQGEGGYTTQDVIEESIPPSRIITEQIPIGYTTSQTIIQPPPQPIYVTTQKFIVIDISKDSEGSCMPKLSVMDVDQLKALADANGLIPMNGPFNFINQSSQVPGLTDKINIIKSFDNNPSLGSNKLEFNREPQSQPAFSTNKSIASFDGANVEDLVKLLSSQIATNIKGV